MKQPVMALRRRLGVVLGVGALLVAGPPAALRAQQVRPAVVVQIAGANLYLNIGSDSGVRAGDTLSVRRSATTAVIGRASVIAATSGSSVITPVGTPWPATRGDTLFITTGNPAVPVAITARERPAAAFGSQVPAAPSMRVDGSFALEYSASHSTSIGLGTDPARSTYDVQIPSVRGRTTIVSGSGNSTFNLSLRAQQRSGPQGLFDKATSVRIYEARFDQRAGPLDVSIGRFYSDFDHASGFWDGASVRANLSRALSAGVAGGYEPEQGNEMFSADVPKYAAFVGLNTGTGSTRFVSDLSYHHTMPKDGALERSVAEFSFRLYTNGFTLTQTIEASPPLPGAKWRRSRFIVNASLPVGTGVIVYASAVSDKPPALDTSFTLPLPRRERVSGGLSYSSPGGRVYADLNGTVNDPRDQDKGYAGGGMLSLPKILGPVGFSVYGSYFTYSVNDGITASPAFDYRRGSTSLRLGYEFLTNSAPGYTATANGGTLRISQNISSRINWVLQATVRTGDHERSTNGYSSFQIRF